MEFTVAEFAWQEGVSVGRIHQRIQDGSLRASKVGGRWRIPGSQGGKPVLSRPLSPANAWALIDLLSGKSPQGLDRVARHRLQRYLQRLLSAPDPLLLLAGWTRRRAPSQDFYINPARFEPDVPRSYSFRRVRCRSESPLVANNRFEGYVTRLYLNGYLRSENAVASDQPNTRIWIADIGGNADSPTPPGLALVYLAEHPDVAATTSGKRETTGLLDRLRH